jgi:hypothetical protein
MVLSFPDDELSFFTVGKMFSHFFLSMTVVHFFLSCLLFHFCCSILRSSIFHLPISLFWSLLLLFLSKLSFFLFSNSPVLSFQTPFSLFAGVFPSLSLGCYYWTINKLDLAQRYIKRSLKKNR